MLNRRNLTLLAIGIVLLSCCLRGPFTSVGSMASIVQESTGLSSSSTGMLTTIPLLAFAVVSPFVGTLCKKFGAGYVLLGSLLVLVLGTLIRHFGGNSCLYIGTAIVGVGIAVGNVLPPAIIKVYFPNKIGLMTSLYSTCISLGASIASAIAIPIAVSFGWKASLFVWLVLIIPTFLVCLPSKNIQLADESNGSSSHIYRHPLTWWITLYTGVQSLMFYCFAAWLASIIQAKGFDSAIAGLLVSAFMLLCIPTSFLTPILAAKMKSQSFLGAGIGLAYAFGVTFLLLADSVPMMMIAIVCASLASGGTFSFILSAFGMRTKNGQDASNLSGIAQCVGYILAATGPVLFGKLYDTTQSWTISMFILIGSALFLAVAGWIIGKDCVIE